MPHIPEWTDKELTCPRRWSRPHHSGELETNRRLSELLTLVVILKIAHYPTLLSVPEEAADAIVSEVEAYKKGLGSMYAEYGCQLLAFEVGRLSGKGGHAHVQVSWHCTPTTIIISD